MKSAYTNREWRLLLCCFAAYTAAYISRTNLSPSLASIAETFHKNAAATGLLPTLFALPYAVCQIIVGSIADRIQARRLMLIGLCGSAAVNIAFAASQSFQLLLALWFVNGVFQSMLWTPIVRIFATQFRSEVRDNALFFISFTLVAGYVAAWALSGFLTSAFSWRIAFLASGTITAAVGLLSAVGLRGVQTRGGTDAADEAAAGQLPRMPVKRLLLHTNLAFLLLCCFGNGYVRDGIMNWATKLVMDTQGLNLNSTVGIVLIIPAVNFIGIRLGQKVFQKASGNVYTATLILSAVAAVFCALLCVLFRAGALACICTLAVISAMEYGLNPLLTSIMPMQFILSNRVALVAGLMDAFIYVGSAFSGAFVGYLADQSGWTAVFVSWVVFAVIGVVTVFWAALMGHKGGY